MVKLTFDKALEVIRTLRLEHDVQKVNFFTYRSAGILKFSQGKVYFDKDKKIKLFEDEYKKIFDYLDSLELIDGIEFEQDTIMIIFTIEG